MQSTKFVCSINGNPRKEIRSFFEFLDGMERYCLAVVETANLADIPLQTFQTFEETLLYKELFESRKANLGVCDLSSYPQHRSIIYIPILNVENLFKFFLENQKITNKYTSIRTKRRKVHIYLCIPKKKLKKKKWYETSIAEHEKYANITYLPDGTVEVFESLSLSVLKDSSKLETLLDKTTRVYSAREGNIILLLKKENIVLAQATICKTKKGFKYVRKTFFDLVYNEKLGINKYKELEGNNLQSFVRDFYYLTD
ncbi:MAG: hypothetical protein RSE00_02695 [Clostridia bacterium]